MRTLLRVAVSATFLAIPFVLVAATLSQPAYTQDVASKGDLALPEKGTDRIVKCGMDFSLLVGLPGWRILEGKRLQAYLTTLFTNVPDGDVMAYAVNGDKVALVLGRDGCVVARQIVPLKTHENVVRTALGRIV